jgi:dienelactone hydrolase
VADVLAGWEKSSFGVGKVTHDLYRRGAGPAVIVISEIPGITPNVVGFGQKVLDLGCTAVLPHLFGIPGKPPSGLYVMDSLARVCISREFSGFAIGRSSPIIDWLRALARAEQARCGGPGVGVVGMCFTGGFGLAMTVEETVVAPVLSQPSLPFPLTKGRRSDIQVSPTDWAKIQARAEQGLCVLGLRFTGDRAVPAERFQLLRQKLGDRFIAVELDSSPSNPHGHPKMAHSVLTEHLQDREGAPTRAALDQVLQFLGSRLGVTGPDF